MSTINQVSTESRSLSESSRVPRGRLFGVLFAAGLLGVLSLSLMPISAEMMAVTGLSENALRLLTMVQPAFLLALAVLAGVITAPSVGLRAPVIEAWLAGRSGWSQLQSQLLPAVIGGVAMALALVVYGALQLRLMPDLAGQEAAEIPLVVRVLYGGITEELLLRWGLMPLLLWLGWRLVQRRSGSPRRGLVWTSIAVTAILFGLGHLPAAAMLGILTPVMGLLIILFNALGGLIFGWLFWRYGLESAIIAHMTAHLVTVLVLLPLATPLLN